MGKQTCHKATLCGCSCWSLPPCPQPPPSPFLVLFLGITGCVAGRPPVLLSPLCRRENTCLEKSGNTSKFMGLMSQAKPRTTRSSPVEHKHGFYSKKNAGFRSSTAVPWLVTLRRKHLPISAFSGFPVYKIDNKHGYSSLSICSTRTIYLKVLIRM